MSAVRLFDAILRGILVGSLVAPFSFTPQAHATLPPPPPIPTESPVPTPTENPEPPAEETYGYCGDGVAVAAENEACDDGNDTNGDGCNFMCEPDAFAPPVDYGFCGDFAVSTPNGEQCDDGNGADYDGCSAECVMESPCNETARFEDSASNPYLDVCGAQVPQYFPEGYPNSLLGGAGSGSAGGGGGGGGAPAVGANALANANNANGVDVSACSKINDVLVSMESQRRVYHFYFWPNGETYSGCVGLNRLVNGTAYAGFFATPEVLRTQAVTVQSAYDACMAASSESQVSEALLNAQAAAVRWDKEMFQTENRGVRAINSMLTTCGRAKIAIIVTGTVLATLVTAGLIWKVYAGAGAANLITVSWQGIRQVTTMNATTLSEGAKQSVLAGLRNNGWRAVGVIRNQAGQVTKYIFGRGTDVVRVIVQ